MGVPFSRAERFVGALTAFSQLYPDTEVLLEEGTFRSLDEKLKKGQLDLIFTNDPEPDPETCIVPLQTEELLLYVAPSLRPKARPCDFSRHLWVDLQQFEDCRFLLPPDEQRTGKISRTIFRDCGYTPRQIFSIPEMSAMLKLAQAGYGICQYSQMRGQAGRLPPEEDKNLYVFGTHLYTSCFCAVYAKRMKYPQRVQAFIRLFQEEFQEEQE